MVDIALQRHRARRQLPGLLAELLVDLVGRHADDLAQPRELLLALLLRVRQIGGLELERQRGAVVDQNVSAAIQDLAAWGLHRDLANLVVPRLLQVLLAREHLQVPQPEEDDREHDQREAAEDRHAQRELRRHQGSFTLTEHHGRETPVARRMRRPRTRRGRDAPAVIGVLALRKATSSTIAGRRAQRING